MTTKRPDFNINYLDAKNYLLVSNLKVEDTIHKIKKPESTFQSYTGENREKEEAEKVRHDLL